MRKAHGSVLLAAVGALDSRARSRLARLGRPDAPGSAGASELPAALEQLRQLEGEDAADSWEVVDAADEDEEMSDAAEAQSEGGTLEPPRGMFAGLSPPQAARLLAEKLDEPSNIVLFEARVCAATNIVYVRAHRPDSESARRVGTLCRSLLDSWSPTSLRHATAAPPRAQGSGLATTPERRQWVAHLSARPSKQSRSSAAEREYSACTAAHRSAAPITTNAPYRAQGTRLGRPRARAASRVPARAVGSCARGRQPRRGAANWRWKDRCGNQPERGAAAGG